MQNMKTCLITILCHHLLTSAYGRLSPDPDKSVMESIGNFVEHNPFQSFDGLVQQSKIVGGTVSLKNRYPYQVALVNQGEQFCGGSLIGSEWVLTAAHCYGFVTHVHIGRYDLGDDSESYENIEVLEEIPHPNYDFMGLDYDFMLLRLKNPSKYATVKLDDGSASLFDGVDLTVIGWGKTSPFGMASDVLLEVEVDYFSRSRCLRRYRFLNADVTSRMLCASRSGKDSCQGDSGGPMIKKGLNGSEDIQVGVVSWGIGCARWLLPGVYSQVSQALDFIDQYVPDRKK